MIDITILGGVGEYGRNCFIITDVRTNSRIMLDCGVRNSEPEVYPSITEEIAQTIQAVFISHVHNDHIGALPLLLEKGFKGEVWMSEASFKQLASIRKLSGINMRIRYFSRETRGKSIPFSKNYSVTWGYSGHMLGSVWYIFQFHKKSIFFSGDMVLDSPLLQTDTPSKLNYDLALIDSGHTAQSRPYKKSIENILVEMSNTDKKYALPITISGKSCDLLFSLFQALPNRKFFIDKELYQHLFCYMEHSDNLRKENIQFYQTMLCSKRLMVNQSSGEPGIYLLKNIPNDYHEINTNQNNHPFFYKSHPDREDLQHLLSHIHAKEYIFFHSKKADLNNLLQLLKSDKQFNGRIIQ